MALTERSLIWLTTQITVTTFLSLAFAEQNKPQQQQQLNGGILQSIHLQMQHQD